jgi:hypothetical protein
MAKMDKMAIDIMGLDARANDPVRDKPRRSGRGRVAHHIAIL